MIEVKDEILNGEPLYRLVDKNGNILFDNLRIEMKTPVIQEGTPINKALFDSIKTDLKNTNTFIDNLEKFSIANVMEDSISSEKNILNISNGLDLNIENRKIDFIIEDSIIEYIGDVIPILSASDLHGFETTKIVYDGTGQESARGSFYRLCDGNDSTSESSGEHFARYIVKVPYLVKPQKLKLIYSHLESKSNNYFDVQGLIEASNDEGKTWIKLLDLANSYSQVTVDTEISTDQFFNMFRITAPSYSAVYPALVYTFQITSKERSVFDSSKESQINGENVSQILQLDKHYKGIYNGSEIKIYKEF